MKKHLNKKDIQKEFVIGMKTIAKSFALKIFWIFCEFVSSLF